VTATRDLFHELQTPSPFWRRCQEVAALASLQEETPIGVVADYAFDHQIEDTEHLILWANVCPKLRGEVVDFFNYPDTQNDGKFYIVNWHRNVPLNSDKFIIRQEFNLTGDPQREGEYTTQKDQRIEVVVRVFDNSVEAEDFLGKSDHPTLAVRQTGFVCGRNYCNITCNSLHTWETSLD